MKNILFVLLFALISCNKETVNGFDGLTAQEQANIRAAFTAKCTTDSNPIFDAFKVSSGKQFDVSISGTFIRNQTWEYLLKNTTTTTPTTTETQTITVWKVDGNNVYFIITRDKDSDLTYKFLKVTKDINDEMIADLQTKYCLHETDFVFSPANSGGPLKIIGDILPSSATENQRTTTTFTYASGLLAYFSLYAEARVVEKLDLTGKVTTTTNYTGTLTRKADAAPAYVAYSSYPAAKTEYCVVKEATIVNTYDVPYTLTCNSDPLTVLLPGFTPSTEL